MLALWVPWASIVQSLLESLLRVEGSLGGLLPRFCLVLPSCTQVVEGGKIVGGAIGLHLIALLLPGDDDVAGVPAGVDDSVEVALGGVLEVATPLLVHLDRAVPAFGMLRIDEFTAFLLGCLGIQYPLLRPHLPRADQEGSRRSHLAGPAPRLHSPCQCES
jgi:hypothetical protein